MSGNDNGKRVQVTNTVPVTGTVTASGTVTLGAGAALVGHVITDSGSTTVVSAVTPPSAGYDGTKTLTTAGTREAIAGSQALTAGVVYVNNTHATAIAYVGFSNVSSSVFAAKLHPGDPPAVLFIDNLSKVYIDSDTNGCTVCYGAS